MESIEKVYEARSSFMHAHRLPSVANYMARFSLILSKTTKVEVDLASVNIQTIEDVLCMTNSRIVELESNLLAMQRQESKAQEPAYNLVLNSSEETVVADEDLIDINTLLEDVEDDSFMSMAFE
ncbi:hypothetical protein CMV_024812 [Castanea mollissima]|uniref:Uncharacterized protein n=1 Tax=Castanea mollissima TaxID=60419 RepID=A0A8J4QHC8_9ROSI|nr:hypothetical protein CMV_024812 [Castanea mollissima]